MKKHIAVCVILGIVSLCLIFLFMRADVSRMLELKFLDYRFCWRPAHSVNPNIFISAIDDSSVNFIGRWPWQRTAHAGLLSGFSRFPPKVIGFDVLFTEPEEGQGEGDKALGYYSKLLGNIVYAGYIDKKNNKKVFPIQQIMDAASCGIINAPPDKDGIIRKVPLAVKYDNTILPSFAMQILCAYLDIKFSDVKVTFGKNISIPKIGEVPIDMDGSMLINYAGSQHAFNEIAFHQILGWRDDDLAMKQFSGKIMLVGVTATGLGDKGHVPVAVNIPLIAVHANALNTILNKDFIIKAPVWANFLIAVIAVMLATVINLFFKSTKAVVFSVLLLASFIACNLWLFYRNVFLDILAPSLGVITPFLLITAYKYGWEERQRRWVRKVFSHYLSREVIESVLKDPAKLKLGGELKNATVLYLDLRNFSGFCEGRPPGEVFGFLNETFDWMTEIILRNGGMLDKYVGDAIISIFGAPAETAPEKQATDAILAALEIVSNWKKTGGPERGNTDVGIGINTGPMLIGNMGSRYIFNYTAIGDEVNIASRIQGLTAEYKVNIIITDSVYNLIKGKVKTAPLGKVAVKGRKDPVVIYSVLEKME